MQVSTCGYFQVPSFADERGTLWKPDVPFEVRNEFYVTNLDGKPRGGHAHRTATQAIWCMRGHMTAILESSGVREFVSVIPEYAIIVNPKTWVTLAKFSPDCCYAVWSNEPYDESEIARDPNEFFKWHGRFPSPVQIIAGELVTGDVSGFM